MRGVCGLWIGESESSKYWYACMNDLKSRGVRDILICSVDGLNGFDEKWGKKYPSALKSWRNNWC